MIDDLGFWLEIRRHLLGIAHAICKRYGWQGLIVLLTGKE